MMNTKQSPPEQSAIDPQKPEEAKREAFQLRHDAMCLEVKRKCILGRMNGLAVNSFDRALFDTEAAEVRELEDELAAIDDKIAENKSEIRGPVWKRARWFTRVTNGELCGDTLRKLKDVKRSPVGSRQIKSAKPQPVENEYEVESVIRVVRPAVAEAIRKALSS